MRDKVTLDTNLLLEYWKQQDRWHVTEELLRLAAAGDIELEVCVRIHEDIPRDPLAQRISELPRLNVQKTAAPFRVGIGIIGRDVVADDAFSAFHETAQRLAKRAGAKDGEPNWKDWDHLQMHYLRRCDVFLTWEQSILLIRRELEAHFGLRATTPEEYLAERQERGVYRQTLAPDRCGECE